MVTLIKVSTLSKCTSIINTAFCYGEKCRLNDNKKLERCSNCNIEAGDTCRYPQTMKPLNHEMQKKFVPNYQSKTCHCGGLFRVSEDVSRNIEPSRISTQLRTVL